MKKAISIFKFFFILLIFFIVVDILFKLNGHGYNNEFKESEVERYPFPYDMFRAKPNYADHNKYGFRGPILDNFAYKKILKIAFFAGSTGFYGTPPIPEILSQNLKQKGIDNVVFNFSSVSSNHSQHLHRLLNFLSWKFDVIIFYGGGNETLSYYFYDTRPGYPYNFFIRNEISPIKHTLIRYSSFFGKLDKSTGWLSGFKKLQRNKNKNYNNWSDSIAENYLNDLKIAERLTKGSVFSEVCKQSIFIPITQPMKIDFNIEREDFKVHFDKIKLLVNKINVKKELKNLENYLNYSYLNNKIIFSDELHTTQDSKKIISSVMVDDLLKILNTKCFN